MNDDEHASRSLPPPCPRRQPRAETDYHKLMSDFDSLVAEASTGKYQQHPGGQSALKGSSPTEEPAPTALSRNRSGGGASGFYATPASNFESSFFRAANFSALLGAGRSAGTPNSRASSSASSVLSEGRLSCVPPARLPPMPVHETQSVSNEDCRSETASGAEASPPLAVRAHRSLLGLLTSKLRRQPPLDLSPRPHSVPVDIADYQRTVAGGESLVLNEDDETRQERNAVSILSRGNLHTSTRPATTGETDPRAVPNRPSRHDGPHPASEVWVDNKSAVDKELEEIERLQAKRDQDRVRREQERLERRQKRDEKAVEALSGAACTASSEHSEVPALSPRSALREERCALLDLIQQDLHLQAETESAARDALGELQRQVFGRIGRDAAFELDQLSIAEEAQHQRKLRTIAERAQLEDKYREERDKQRRWEIVRDTVVDEEQHRLDVLQVEASCWERMLDDFFVAMDAPWMHVISEERLTRMEYWLTMETEAFMNLERRFVCDYESLLRRRSERAWVSLTASAISVPLLLYNRMCRIVLDEAARRRQTLVAETIAHSVMWERFCEDVGPLVDRALWKTQTSETDARVQIEQECAEDGAVVFHGCATSRELVTRYAAVVREMHVRRAQHREEALMDIFEDELAERILAQRDEREAFILIEEMWRRGLDTIRINLKKRHIHDAMQAAEVLRQAEVQRAVIEEERQKNARAIANQNRTVSTPSSEAPTRAGRKLSTPSSTARPKQPAPSRK